MLLVHQKIRLFASGRRKKLNVLGCRPKSFTAGDHQINCKDILFHSLK